MLTISESMPHFIGRVAGAQGIPLLFKQFPNETVLIGRGNVGQAYPETNVTELDFPGLELSAATSTTVLSYPGKHKNRKVLGWHRRVYA